MTDQLVKTSERALVRPLPQRSRMPRISGMSVAMTIVVAVVVLFLLAPLIVVALSSVTSSGYLTFPPKGFSLHWYSKVADTPGFVGSFVTSLQLGATVTIISVVVCVPAAYAIARYPTRVTRALEQIFLSPLLLPAVVLGLGLLFTLSRSGWRGTFTGAVLAHLVITSPFVLRSCLAGLRRTDSRIEEASRSLGAGPVRTFCRIVLPSIAGSVASGAIFAFVVSFDEAVVTLFLVGPDFTTLPVRIFTYVQYSNDPNVAAASTVLVILSLIMVTLVMWLSNAEERRERRSSRK